MRFGFVTDELSQDPREAIETVLSSMLLSRIIAVPSSNWEGAMWIHLPGF